MPHTAPTRRASPSEQGYVLLGVLILVVLFVIAMAVAAPRIAASIQRDREVETMHRGKQYVRAIQLYYRKFHAYPPNIDALVKTSEIRFLRRKYIDPITGKDDWKPVAFGQNKTPIAMGFFGQPLGGTGGNVLAGIGPQGGNGLDNGGLGNNPGSVGGGLFSNGSAGTGQAGTGQSGSGQSGIGGTTDQSGGSQPGSTMGTGPTFGGAGIIGVSPASPKKSILLYKKKDHYSDWEFLYSPLSEMQQIGGGNTNIGQPVTGPGGIGGGGSGIGGGGVGGGGIGGGGIGGGGIGGGGMNPTPAPTPTPAPQQ